MHRLNKYICFGLTAGLIVLNLVDNAEAFDSRAVTVFVGPQSLSPRETIAVTVQISPSAGNFSGTEKVELTYTADGDIKTLVGHAAHGLLSFDIAAQDRSGVMKFSAKVADQASQDALVSVVPGLPQKLFLKIKPSDQPQQLILSSGQITDAYDNAVSDQTLLALQWKDESGLIKSQNAQLLNGQLDLEVKCPSSYSGELIIRAHLKTVQFSSSDLSAFCYSERA